MDVSWMTPNLAYLLLISGTVTLIFALLTPGTGLLEVAAMLLLVMTGYGATQLAVTDWAVLVWIAGVVFFGLAVRQRRRDKVWLGLSLLALMAGSVFVFRDPTSGEAVSPALAAVVSLVVGVGGWYLTRAVLTAEARPPAHTLERIIGKHGEARTPIAPEGTVYVDGELWTARSTQPIPAGAAVRVVGREGLILLVVEDAPPPAPAPENQSNPWS